MEKFGMSFGGGPSKKELLDIIETQKKQLIQYQTRFKDIVQAYKSLLKEKEALEASLKVLTVSQEDLHKGLPSGGSNGPTECPVPSELADDHCSVHSEDSLDTAASVDTAAGVISSKTKGDPAEEDQNSHGECPSLLQQSEKASVLDNRVPSSSSTAMEQTVAESDRRVIQLKSQLATLTMSLATVTQEKSRMEASFQADKRKMKQELDEAHKKMEEAFKQHQNELQTLQEQLAESRARVITQQHEREQEQSDHAHMLRELQKLLQEERSLRQDVELKLEDAREALVETMQAADRGLDYEEQLKAVAQECEALRNSLEAADAERNEPNQRVVKLEQEIADLKAHFNQQLQQEIQKVAQAEEGLREQAQLEERRVASLEERVSELSELLGASEKARQKDQQNAQRLRERILQLDAENKTLAIAASTTRTSSSDLDIDEANLDVNSLRNRLEKVKKLLQLAAQRSPDQSLEIEKLLEGNTGQDGENVSVQYYQQELWQVREEFERYKVRAQVVLKNKNAKDGTQAKELEEARDQLSELKEKYINLRVQLDEAEVRHKQEAEDRQQALIAVQQAHKHDLEKLEAQHREDLLHLEGELHKQRERTMALLEEKDLELEKLRVFRSQNIRDIALEREVERDLNVESCNSGLEECETISEALKFAGSNEPTLLLYAEQLARNEVEISTLRKMKHRLEEDVHQLQTKLIFNGERHEEEVAKLRAQLEKHMRDKGREGANLEYLKNVIYRFLTLQDSRGRQQTLTAILTILHFSPQEKQAIVKQHVQSWWTPGIR
ncbi:GRIP and coiled-coil domain-containing protein 1 [Trichomycterus rosablanca]|uniref:GRIP and coiled-coil domain-containing protein 1 n=1 Tax=Trichomycterus rosablanca TaxID=2290929 RepID=UPI002F35921D